MYLDIKINNYVWACIALMFAVLIVSEACETIDLVIPTRTARLLPTLILAAVLQV